MKISKMAKLHAVAKQGPRVSFVVTVARAKGEWSATLKHAELGMSRFFKGPFETAEHALATIGREIDLTSKVPQ